MSRWGCVVKTMRWGACALLLMVQSCLFPGSMSGQKPGSVPPKQMRLCITANGKTTCNNLVYTGEYYEAREDHDTKIQGRYWIQQWEDGHVVLTGKTAFAVSGGFPLDSTFDGHITPDGAHMSGNLDWRVGYSASGTAAYTLAWSKDTSNALDSQYVGQFESPHFSKLHPNIALPPGAVEQFASFPDFMRAVLQPESPLMPDQAKLLCNTKDQVADSVALEIGKFAYRAADFPRGYCWLKRAANKGNVRAEVLLGASALMGWGTPKNENAAFKIFSDTDGKKDMWNAWFLEKCYSEGLGTPVNKQMAARIDTYLMIRQEGRDLFMSVGADDAEVQKANERALLYLHPPMTSHQTCRPGLATEAGVVNGQYCSTVQTVDENELQRRLKSIN